MPVIEQLLLYRGQLYTHRFDLEPLIGAADLLHAAAVEVSPQDGGLNAQAEITGARNAEMTLVAHTMENVYRVRFQVRASSGFHWTRSYRVVVVEAPQQLTPPVNICLQCGSVRGFELDYHCRLLDGETLTGVRRKGNHAGFFVSPRVDENGKVQVIIGATHAVAAGKRDVTLVLQTSAGRYFEDQLRIVVEGDCG